MTDYYLDGQKPIYRNPSGTKSITLDPTNNTLTITDTSIPKTITINSQEFSNGAQTLTYVKLYEKVNACDALVFPAPSATQLQVENYVAITDTPNSKNVLIDATIPQISMNDGTFTPYINITANRLNISGNSTGVDIDSNSSSCRIGDIGFVNNGTLFELDDTTQTINLNTINFNTFNSTYALPICYTKKFAGSFSYVGVNNTWQNVYQDNLALPNEFFNPSNQYWNYKIEFSINLRNVSIPTDKGLALYFEFLDNASNVMTPFLYNQSTPFTRHSNGSTYSATSSDMLTFNWNDFCDFSLSANNPPLTFSLWWYGDQNNAPDFDIVLSLTRTNLV